LKEKDADIQLFVPLLVFFWDAEPEENGAAAHHEAP
jgi:hypothetical protein